ncbi:MAG: DNA repair protein RadA, partial [Micrococcales bacterium]|nr:DNA repair protein RadA [Micrococcales bacterium]
AALAIEQVSAEQAAMWPTGVAELDRVLGGGLVPGSVTLIGGEPGVGKSTLLLDVAARSASSGQRALYVTGEETTRQVKLRADRIGAVAPGLKLAAANQLEQVVALTEQEKPALLVLDSIQTLSSQGVEGTPGGVAHVRAVTAELVRLAKTREMACLLVGHVTKDGTVAGPRTLEHLVDVVCLFEGESHSALRWLRATKNRFGPADEVGCFELTNEGIRGVADPSGLFMDKSGSPVTGSALGVAMEGRRPVVVEVQALVAPSSLANPRRTTSGLDQSRLTMILAVLNRRCGLSLGSQDVFASTVGGVRVTEPAFDLTVALACASARFDLLLDQSTISFGEVSLGGQIRPVGAINRRLEEAARMGMTKAIVPPGCAKAGSGNLEINQVSHLSQALRVLEAAGAAI